VWITNREIIAGASLPKVAAVTGHSLEDLKAILSRNIHRLKIGSSAREPG
jgi:hypothetical protein